MKAVAEELFYRAAVQVSSHANHCHVTAFWEGRKGAGRTLFSCQILWGAAIPHKVSDVLRNSTRPCTAYVEFPVLVD